MKIGWMYPHRERCGIARYALDYADELRKIVDLVDIDPAWWFENRRLFLEKTGACDVVHLQYDTAGYMRGRRDFFGAITRLIKVPLVVSLHEVYEEDPAVFSRSEITGRFPLLQAKRMLWDFRHPVQRAFKRHCAGSFNAGAVLVHHRYHADIIAKKGCVPDFIRVEPMPVKRYGMWQEIVFKDLPAVRLGALGFVNPLFDYDMLFDVLKRMKRSWSFTWIGGVRTAAEQPLLDKLVERIAGENWTDRFFITGWVPEADLTERLASIDIICALFRERSSSASLARAMGAGRAVIATTMQLTREIASANQTANAAPPLLLTERDAGSIVDAIEGLCADECRRNALSSGLRTYGDAVSFETMAQRLCTMYRGLLTP